MTGFSASTNLLYETPTKPPAVVLSVDIDLPLRPLSAGDGRWAYVIVHRSGRVIGQITCPVREGFCYSADLSFAIATHLTRAILIDGLAERLRLPVRSGTLELSDLYSSVRRPGLRSRPLISVAVCTRNRPEQLVFCLASLARIDYQELDVIVVDNAPNSDRTCQILTEHYPQFRYVREERPGLDHARNRALQEAFGDLLAFTDDDVVVDTGWVDAIVRAFEESPELTAVTGLVAPLELRSEAQIAFELLGGFGRGYRQAWYRVTRSDKRSDSFHIGAGRFGAGANMVFRRNELLEMGGFDPALDVGTPAGGGGDLEAFFRILQEGHALKYDPSVIVWHRHRKDFRDLAGQIASWGTAVGAFLTAAALRYRTLGAKIVAFAAWWWWFGYFRPFISAVVKPSMIPLSIHWRPLLNTFSGPFQYFRGRCGAAAQSSLTSRTTSAAARERSWRQCAEHTCELGIGITPLTDIANYLDAALTVYIEEIRVGRVSFSNRGHPISAAELRATVSEKLLEPLLTRLLRDPEHASIAVAECELRRHVEDYSICPTAATVPPLVSIVIATRRRVKMLERCLNSIEAQRTNVRFEVLVVDNDPGSPDVRQCVTRKDGVRYVAEPIEGLATARNAGIRASKGDIIVMTDDDVVAPPSWLAHLIEPFQARHIGVVTGNVLPLVLETPSQVIFESSGGLGKGERNFEVGHQWLASTSLTPPRVWDLGATANAAVRREVFQDSRVGLLDEALGPGTPAGVGEDTYFFYRTLLAGYNLFYSGEAAVFHDHRNSLPELRRQMYNYSKGHVAYLLTTLFRHGDLRALPRLLLTLPWWHIFRLVKGPEANPSFDRSVVTIELIGYAAGPFGWLRGLCRARRLRTKRKDATVQHTTL
jgi:GT2 family glycosyltransferase